MEREETSERKIFFIVAGIIAAVIILIVVLYVIQVPYTVKESYQDKEPSIEHYTESVPYQEQECNMINAIIKPILSPNSQSCLQTQCSHMKQVCIEKNFWGNCVTYDNVCDTTSCIKYNNHCELNIENKESEILEINLQLMKYSSDTKTTSNVSGYPTRYLIYELDTKKITWDFVSTPTESVTCNYNIFDYPTKKKCEPVTKYRDEDRTRTIYNTVTKYRDVTKYCSLLSKIAGSCN